MSDRRIIGHCTLTLDGFSSGPDGPAHDTWLQEHTLRPETAAYFEGLWRGCDTALMGKNNYEGFAAVWPSITEAPETDARTRALGTWLGAVDKGVVSTTMTEADANWGNSRVFRSAQEAVSTLKAEEGRDILVLSSATLIQSLLREDLIDELKLVIVPVLVGGGLRLLPEGVAARWQLSETMTLPDGAVGLGYRR